MWDKVWKPYASIFILKKVFEIDNSSVKKAKIERLNSQYYPDSDITKEKSIELISIAEEFNSYIRNFLDNINNQDIEDYRNKLKELIN